MPVGELDPLLESLSFLCNYHHVATTKESLCYGMPLKNGRMDVHLLDNAAKRAGLVCDIEHGTRLESLSGLSNPVIIFMDDGSAAGVLLSIDRKFAKVYFPGKDILGITLPLSELKSLFNGTVAYIRPQLVLSGYKNAWDFVKRKKDSLKSPLLNGIQWYAAFCLFAGFILSGLILLIPFLLYNGHKIGETLESGLVEQKVAVLFLASTLFLKWVLIKEIWRRYDLVVKTKLEAKIHEQTFVLSQPISQTLGMQHNDYFFSKQLAREVSSAESIQFSFRFCFCLLGLIILSIYQPVYGMALQLYLLVTFLAAVIYFNYAKSCSIDLIEADRIREEVIYNAFKHREVIKWFGAWDAHYKNIFDFIRLKSVSDVDGFYDSGVITIFALRLIGVVALELCISYWVTDFAITSMHLFASVIFLLIVFFSSSLIGCINKFKKVDAMMTQLNKTSSYSTITDLETKVITTIDFDKGMDVKLNESEFSVSKSPGHPIAFRLERSERAGFIFDRHQDADTFVSTLVGKKSTDIGHVKYGDDFVEHISSVALKKEIAIVGSGELVNESTLFENIILGLKSVTRDSVLHTVNQLGMMSVIDWHRLGLDRPIRKVGETGYFEDRAMVQLVRGVINEATVWIFMDNSKLINISELINAHDFFKKRLIVVILSKKESAQRHSQIGFSCVFDMSRDEIPKTITVEDF